MVYEAEDTRLGRRVALKAVSPRFGRDPDRRERLRREARAAAALSHPGIATVYALEEFGGHLYIASEYVPGHTLRDEVARGPLPIAEVLDTALDVSRALAAAHERGIVHRDLKPENVIRTTDGRIKIVDFGLAGFGDTTEAESPLGPRLTKTGVVLGTPGYMSPEQLRGRAVDFRTDIFSFGVLVYELAAGVNPFAASDPASTIARILESEPIALGRRSPAIPPALVEIVARCLRKDRDERLRPPPSCGRRWKRYLQAARLHLTTHPPRQVPMRRVRRPRLWRSTLAPVRSVHSGGGSAIRFCWAWAITRCSIRCGIGREWMAAGNNPLLGWYGGSVIFFLTLLGVAVAGNLRLHLWFTSRFDPEELSEQMGHSSPWIRRADMLFVLALVIGALAVVGAHPALATLLVAVAIGCGIGFAFIEPATTRAAFRRASAARLES